MINNKGFTLIEVIVVMGLLVAIAGLVGFANLDTWRAFTFRGERNLLVSVLQKARSQSVSNICLGAGCSDGKSHGLAIRPSDHSDADVIFQGSNYITRDSAFDEIIGSASTINYASSTISEVIFAQLSGDASTIGDINLNDGVRSTTISIKNEGRIDY